MPDLAPIPTSCPPERVVELSAARSAAMVDARRADETWEVARQARADAASSKLHYENLVAEVNGQGTLDL